MITVEIRQATNRDFDTIYKFINELEDCTFDRFKQEMIYLKNIQNPNYIYLIAFKGPLPVGFVSCHAQELLHHSGLVGEIQEMFVANNSRSAGVGRLLMERLRKLAKAKRIIQLEVTSNKVRQRAHVFYVKEGFRESHLKFTLPL